MARILVVDDDAASRQSIRALMELEKHEVEEAREGWDGLARMEHRFPDLISCTWIWWWRASSSCVARARNGPLNRCSSCLRDPTRCTRHVGRGENARSDGDARQIGSRGRAAGRDRKALAGVVVRAPLGQSARTPALGRGGDG